MSELNFKKYSDLDVLENISDTSHVVIEENGDVKRFPANGIGKVKTVNGAEPDENGNVDIPNMVKSVNSVEPDENGNVAIETGWNNLTDKPTESIDGVEKLKEEIIPDTIARTSDIPTDFSVSWNDLEDKPFGDIVEKEEIFLTLNLSEPYSSGSTISSEGSTINTTYPYANFYVEFNKTNYPCTIEQYSGKYPGQYVLIIGNKQLVFPSFPTDNGLPFCIMCNQPKKTATVYFREDIVDPTIEGFTGTPGVKFIDEKFIPIDAITQSIIDALPTAEGGSF